MISNNEICGLTLAAASELIRDARLSPVDLTKACLERIAGRDKELNSFICVYEQQALVEAETLTDELQSGCYRGPLHGVPIALKDLIDVSGLATTAASALFVDRIAAADAKVVRRLKDAGAVILGKTNLHEFAYGGSGMISYFGITRNPVNPAYITGGSSSGSAAAVAAGFCFAAIGTDTAGSIRLPAAYCCVVGLKPTYSLVSTNGIVPLSSSYDHVGPITRTVEDAALVLQAITDADLKKVDAAALRFAVGHRYFFDECQEEIANAVNAIAAKLGAVEVEIPVDEDRTVSNAEAFSYHQDFVRTAPEKYHPETLRRIRSGENITAQACIPKRRELEAIRTSAADLFRSVDVILTPTVAISPSLISALQAKPGELRPRELMMLRNTRPFNVLGVPAMSIPCGRTDAGLPIGIQLAAAPGREDVLIAAGKVIESIIG